MLRIRDRIYQIYADATGQPVEPGSRNCNRNKWLNDHEMVEYGLADQVLNRMPVTNARPRAGRRVGRARNRSWSSGRGIPRPVLCSYSPTCGRQHAILMIRSHDVPSGSRGMPRRRIFRAGTGERDASKERGRPQRATGDHDGRRDGSGSNYDTALSLPPVRRRRTWLRPPPRSWRWRSTPSPDTFLRTRRSPAEWLHTCTP